MDALSKARIAVENSGEGPSPFTPPKATHSTSGVSVEYTPEPGKGWFVLRASYGRSRKAADLLISQGHYVYAAQRYEYRTVNGRKRKELRELIPNMLFAYAGREEIRRLLSRKEAAPSPLPQLAMIATFYYNHFVREEGRNPPLEIPERQMLDFIRMTVSRDENIVYVSDGSIVHVKKDDPVLVTEGKFKGCMGKVVRIAGQQRVGLQLAELGWVATSYVPTAFIEVVPRDVYDARLREVKPGSTAARKPGKAILVCE